MGFLFFFQLEKFLCDILIELNKLNRQFQYITTWILLQLDPLLFHHHHFQKTLPRWKVWKKNQISSWLIFFKRLCTKEGGGVGGMTFIDEDGISCNHVLHVDPIHTCQINGNLKDCQRTKYSTLIIYK